MAYLALYRKWRPRTFDEVVGQKHISIPLLRALEQNRPAHAYLFSGSRGTGKTSMARIMAKAINCLQPINGNPCNECTNCVEINQGSSLDVYEIDGASNRGVDEILEIRKSIPTLPVACRKKVYIIDEVHMLTKEAFNALLKTLEEPPSHVLFILATTEPGRVPVTILSRCQRYEFHRISVPAMKEHLLSVAAKSDISLSPEAADLIAVRADGGLRDALSLLDQCSALAAGQELTVEMVYQLLGLTGKDQIIQLTHYILENKNGEVLQLFYDILQTGKDPGDILRDLLEHLRSIMVCKVNPQAPELSAYGKNISLLKEDADKISAPYLDALFSSLHETVYSVKKSSSPRMNAEMGLLRLCRIKGSQALDSLTERIEQLEQEIERLKKNGISAPLTEHAPSSSATFNSLTASASTSSTHSSTTPIKKSTALKDTPIPPSSVHQTTITTETHAAIPTHPIERAPIKETIPTPTNDTLTTSPEKSTPTKTIKKDELTPNTEQVISPSEYDKIWKQMADYLKQIYRIDIWNCVQKSSLLLVSNTRAVAVAPMKFILVGLDNPSYQKVISEGFQKILGYPLLIRGVLKNSSQEKDIHTYLESISFSSSSNRSTNVPSSNEYTLIKPQEISKSEKEDKTLTEALKILPNCDIYRKE